MALSFEWNENKASTNLEKHDVSFEEATTVFGDAWSITISDPLHSIDEDRFIIIGCSCEHRLVVVIHTERGIIYVSLVPDWQQEEKGIFMSSTRQGNKKKNASDMLSEYDFRGGVRGKYAKRYQEGSNVIALDRDVAKVFMIGIPLIMPFGH